MLERYVRERQTRDEVPTVELVARRVSSELLGDLYHTGGISAALTIALMIAIILSASCAYSDELPNTRISTARAGAVRNLSGYVAFEGKNFCFLDNSGNPQSGRIVREITPRLHLVAKTIGGSTQANRALRVLSRRILSLERSTKVRYSAFLSPHRLRRLLRDLGELRAERCEPFLAPTPTPTPTPEPTEPDAGVSSPPIAEPTPSPTPSSGSVVPADQPPPLVIGNNRISITSQAALSPGASRTHVPVQLGRTFVQGEIPNFPQALIEGTPALTQADVKTRWPDGSVNHVIISFLIPSLPESGTITVAFQNQLTGNNTGFLSQNQMLAAAFDFDATTSLTNEQQVTVTASARALLEAGAYTYWLQGPVATSIILADHSAPRSFDIGFDGYKSVRPIYHATFYPALNKVRVRFIGEIANTEALKDVGYSLELALGESSPTTVYSRPDFIHTCNTRWTKEFWLGGAPARFSINHNLEYLTLTKAVPNYDTRYTIPQSVIESLSASWAEAQKELGDTGLLTPEMSAPGGQESVGPLPGWHTRWLYSGDSRLQEISLGNSELAARWPIHFREGRVGGIFDRAGTAGAVGRVVSIQNRPTLYTVGLTQSWGAVQNNSSDRVTPIGQCSNRGWAPDRGHEPDLFSAPYLLTGDYFFLEELQFFASYTAAAVNPIPGDDGRGPVGHYGHIGASGGAEKLAWPLRNRALAAYLTPDAQVEKSYFRTLLFDVIAAYEGMFGLPSSSFPGYSPTTMRNYGAGVGTSCRSGPGLTVVPCSPLGHFELGAQGSAGLSTSGNINYGTALNTAYQSASPWSHYYLVHALEAVTRLGFPGEALLNQAGKAILGQLTEPGFNPYLVGQPRWPTTRATLAANGSLSVAPFQSWTQVLAAFTGAAQTTASFNATSPNGDPADPEGYIAAFHGATRGVFEYGANQSEAQAADGVWDALIQNTPTASAVFSSGNPKWALRCTREYC